VAGGKDGGGTACICERVYHLPTGLSNPRKKPFWSRATDPPLPGSLSPVNTNDERTLLKSIIHELMGSFGVSLNPEPVLERRVATPADPNGTNRFVVIGASHMTRMSEFLPQNTTVLAYPGFRPEKCKIAELCGDLARGGTGQQDVVVLDLLSNLAFMGSDSDGIPTPAVRAGDGRFHIVGALTTAPPTALKRALEQCNPLAQVLKGNRIVLVCPIPRYVKSKCCDDTSHITNFAVGDYEEELMDFQEQHRKILGGWATSQGLDHEIFDVTTVVNPTEPGLGNRLTSCGSALWSATDGVHLSREGYRDMAMGLIDLFKSDDPTGCLDDTSSTSSTSCKRRRPDSVVTVPAKKRPGGASRTPAMAEWVTGRKNPAERADERRDGRRDDPAFPQHGRYRSRGGVGWRARGWGFGRGKRYRSFF
jgi:hypothetical protein